MRRTITKLMIYILLAMFPAQARAETILLNGLVSVIPPIGLGLQKTASKVDSGVPIPLLTPIEGEIIAAIISGILIKRFEKGTLKGPIVIAGHSYGAIMGTRIAHNLWKHNPPIPVAYLGLLDGPTMEPIYGNVKVVDNFRPSFGGIGESLKLDKSFKGEANEFRIHHPGHVTFTWTEELQKRLVSQILRAQQ